MGNAWTGSEPHSVGGSVGSHAESGRYADRSHHTGCNRYHGSMSTQVRP